VVGTWQGTLPSGDFPRVAMTLKAAADGSLHGGYAHFDRGPGMIPLTTASFSAPELTVTQAYAAMNFQARLSADGKTLDGTWIEGKQTFPLTLTRATPETLWKHDGPAPLPAMAASADPAFEVATIKPSRPDEFLMFGLRDFKTQDTSLKELIKLAYDVRGRQVLGGPAWLDEDKYDIVAEPDAPGVPTEEQNRAMLRKLLAERFGLKVHLGTQVFPVLAVTLDPKARPLTPSDPEFNGHGSIYLRTTEDGQMQMEFAGQTVAQFIGLIMNFFQDRQLVDESGLTGIYDITLTVPASVFQGQVKAGPEDDRGPELMAAAQRIGFRFEPKKEPLPVVVIDHVEKPSAN
jgi:uncharacterized protein (TIGR03435 family)